MKRWLRAAAFIACVPALLNAQVSTSNVRRKAILNDYLEVATARTVLTIVGSTREDVQYSLQYGIDAITGRPIPAANYTGRIWSGSTTWADHFTIHVGEMDSVTAPAPLIRMEMLVPRDLKILHVIVKRGGSVDIRGLSSEVSVVIDSGSVTGSDLEGDLAIEARRGGISLDLTSRVKQTGSIDLLSHSGSVSVILGTNPSMLLDMQTICGRIHVAFPFNPPPKWKSAYPVLDPEAVNCKDRPASLPPIPGTIHLRYASAALLGTGNTRFHALAVQGDISITRKGSN